MGRRAALFVDPDSKRVKAKAAWEVTPIRPGVDRLPTHVDIVDVTGDQVCEFMNRGAWGDDAALMDHSGKVLWSYGGMPGVDDMCAGDVDGDGVLEFAVSFNGGGGVHLLDRNGKKRWQRPDGNAWHIEMTDVNGDGKLEIVNSGGGGITVRDARGNTISESGMKAPSLVAPFSLCRWPGKQGPARVLCCGNGVLWLIDFDGEVQAEFKTPQVNFVGHARGLPVQLEPASPNTWPW